MSRSRVVITAMAEYTLTKYPVTYARAASPGSPKILKTGLIRPENQGKMLKYLSKRIPIEINTVILTNQTQVFIVVGRTSLTAPITLSYVVPFNF